MAQQQHFSDYFHKLAPDCRARYMQRIKQTDPYAMKKNEFSKDVLFAKYQV